MEYRQGIKRLLTLTGWKQFLKILDKKEKIAFFVFSSLALISFLFLTIDFYFKNTEIRPAKGGVYIEGIVGSPRWINPIYPAYDVDRDLIELIYAGLMKYDEKGEIVLDLAKGYEIIEDGKIFEFRLKENLLWSDGQPLTADDVIFTIETIQNPATKSPIRAKWLGVTVKKVSDLTIYFELKNPSAVFLENCTLKIIPKHVWEKIPCQNFSLSAYNLEPIGAGPYLIKNAVKDKEDKTGNIKSLELAANPNYHGEPYYIPKIIFYFFNNENELISALNSRQIKGFFHSPVKKYDNLKTDEFSEYRLLLPSYFAVFFNPEEAKVLANEKIRQALNYATDKEEIIREISAGKGKTTDSPILPEIYGFENPAEIYEFDPEEAERILDEAGFVKNENGSREKTTTKQPAFQFKNNLQTGSQGSEVQELQKCLAKDPDVYPAGEISGYFGEKTKSAVIKFQEKYKEEILVSYGLTAGTGSVLKSTRDKLNQLCAAPSTETASLSFTLTTSVADAANPILEQLADLLKKQWGKIGINIEIQTVVKNGNGEIKDFSEGIIKPRNYQMVLYGQVLELIPDPFVYWHSSQIKDPGLNLAGYENKDADKLLEKARQTLDKEKRQAVLEEFQDILIKDAPAVFLYSPEYSYFISKEVRGATDKIVSDPSKRFSDMANWYFKTERAFK